MPDLAKLSAEVENPETDNINTVTHNGKILDKQKLMIRGQD